MRVIFLDNFQRKSGFSSFFTVLNGLHSKLGYIGKHIDIVEQIIDMTAELVAYIDATRDLLRKTDDIREENFQKVSQNLEATLAQTAIDMSKIVD